MLRIGIPTVFVLAAIGAWACAPEGDSAGGAGEARQTYEISQDDRYIIHFEDEDAAARHGAQLGGVAAEIPGVPAAAFHLQDHEIQGLLEESSIRSIEPDPRRELHTGEVANAAGRGDVPPGLAMVGASDVWGETSGQGVEICVVDSGYDMGHESLPRAQVSGAHGAAAEPWDADSCGHGTHVAGILAALDNNDEGALGLLPEGAVLHIVKAFGEECQYAYASEIVSAVDECRQSGADVVNMSFGGGDPSEAEEAAFEAFYEEEGMLLVGAAGNRGDERAHYPASYDAVISVAAVDGDGDRAPFSNYSEDVELAAPGAGVLSTVPMDGCLACERPAYAPKDGTSMAAPHVAGVAALAWSAHPEATNEEIREALASSARDLGSRGRNAYYGYGLVRAPGALEELGGHCAEAGCAGDRSCDEETGQCVGDLDSLAFYDFAGESARPADAIEAAGAGAFEVKSGDLEFTAEGSAIERGFRDEDENYFEVTFDPDSESRLYLTDLGFQERPSSTGPRYFAIEIVDEESGRNIYAGEGQTEPDAWSDQRIFLGGSDAGPFEGPVTLRIRGGGAESANGTWRIDNVHIEGRAEGRVQPPEIESAPPESVRIAGFYRYEIEASGDPDPAITVEDLPYWLFFDGVDTIWGSPPPIALGETDPITVRAENEAGGATEQTFAIEVEPMWPFSSDRGLFAEDFGEGLPDGWYAGGDWEVGAPAAGPREAAIGHGVAATGLDENYEAPGHSALTSPAMDLAGMEDPALRFESWHRVDSCYHGVNVLVSTDGGATFRELDPESVAPRYDGEVEDTAGENALEGQRAWCGDSGGWETVEVALDPNLNGARDDVMVKLQLGADGVGARPGWYVDDFRVGPAEEIGARTATQTLAFYDFRGGSQSASETSAAATAGDLDDRAGTAGTVLGNPGRALIAEGWDEGEQYFETSLTPAAGDAVKLTGLTFHERPSSSGPAAFDIQIERGGSFESALDEPTQTRKGAWTSRAVRLDEPIALDGETRVRFVGEGATHPQGTWRLDNVRLTGHVE